MHLPKLHQLAKMNTPEADETILHYCMEGIRLNGTFGLYREATTSVTLDDDGRKVPVKAGERVFVSFVRLFSFFPPPSVSHRYPPPLPPPSFGLL